MAPPFQELEPPAIPGRFKLKDFDPSIDCFAIPNWSAVELLEGLRKVIVAKTPIGDGLL
jgi:hypothetical protein